MVQGADGYWYAYIVESNEIAAADSNANLEYGTAGSVSGVTFNSAITVYTSSSSTTINVINHPPTLSPFGDGQINVDTNDEWPFIQALDFTLETIEIRYEQPGPDEVVTLKHDNDDIDDYASFGLDRAAASQNSEVHITITDQALNLDPTAEDVVMFRVTDTDGTQGVSFNHASSHTSGNYAAFSNGFDDNGKLKINLNANNADNAVLSLDTTLDDETADAYLIFFETAENSGVFVNTDDDDNSSVNVASNALRGTTATVDYNDSAASFVVTNYFATIDMDVTSVGDEWNSGEEMTVVLYDQDLNLNTFKDEDLTVRGGTLVPSLQIGSPLSLTSTATVDDSTSGSSITVTEVTSFSKIAKVASTALADSSTQLVFKTGITGAQWETYVDYGGSEFISFDVRDLTDDVSTIAVGTAHSGTSCVDTTTTNAAASNNAGSAAGVEYVSIAPTGTCASSDTDIYVTMAITSSSTTLKNDAAATFVVDFFSFSDSVNHAIYRLELEETGDNTAEFAGTLEYVMLNQLNSDANSIVGTAGALNPIQDDPNVLVHLDMTDEDSLRVNYLDLGADGVSTQIADQEEAPTHSGTADLDLDSYKIADTVVVTIEDQDLNTDSELIDVYLTSTNDDLVGDGEASGTANGLHIMDITFDDSTWTGLFETGFNLVETGIDSGIFVGSFQVPETANGNPATGTDIEVNYNDHRDGSGNTIEVGDGASIRANTGSVAFDRTVYPVPWTSYDVHATALSASADTIGAGPVQTHIRITDADYDISATGEDSVTSDKITVKISRGSLITADLMPSTAVSILETAPDSATFEYDLTIGSSQTWTTGTGFTINQGDIITVEYTDPQDASGEAQTVTDSSSFDLRNGVLQSDKSVYLIGSDMILTLIEPDFDLDNDETESYTLDLIEWDSDAAETSMGPGAVNAAAVAAFDPEPSTFRETGDSTGIFQVVIEIPDTLNGNLLDRGEKIELEYTDEGPAGADYVGQEDEDIGLTVYTSNFGATIELDQKVYTWTDKVYITVVAPDHNFDSGLVDNIGESANDPIKVSTRGNEINRYQLVESGADTGIFIGEVTLTGMQHDADGDGTDDISSGTTSTSYNGSNTQTGPTEGQLATTDNDGLTVSFEFSEDETVVGSALIRWNIGEVQWLEASYPASGTGVVRVIDADMSLDPEAIDNFSVDVWSDSDAGGIDLTVTETNEATGIFEGTVFFTTTDDSSGHRLRVAEGDTVTAEYEDNTLPDPYTTADELDITATSLIGTVVPPLERAPAANLRTVDAFGNSLNAVSVDQQVQLTADLANGQDREQAFAYLVQVQDGDGVTVSLAWITGSLSSGQSFSPALSWIPTESGSYTATAFVWESVDNPTALSPPVSTTINVQ